MPSLAMKTLKTFSIFICLVLVARAPVRADAADVATAVNALGLDLYRAQSAGSGNLLFSPYSIQNALAMTYNGAAGDTRAEMQRVLHYPADDAALNSGFAEVARALAQIRQDSIQAVAAEKNSGGRHPSTPVKLEVANRLFAQSGYPLRAPFLSLVKENYDAPVEQLDFAAAKEQARAAINGWVEQQTKGKISNLIPPGGVSDKTRLALANAIYLHAGWEHPFEANWTRPAEFFVHGADRAMVPTMNHTEKSYGYLHRDDFTAVALPYVGRGIQFLVLLPDARDGLPSLERKLTPALLAECANLPPSFVNLYLPKFKIEPPSISLGRPLEELGMKSAFDDPKHSANFDRMAPRKPDDYLYIGAIFHKAFLALDEDGTEAAAATVVEMMQASMARYEPYAPKPIEVHVDHPFIFAIQHVASGTCLFLGRVNDPR
jgi:serine protease inhibitor